MSLHSLHTAFEAELLEPIRVFEELATRKSFTATSDFTTDDLCVLEGVLSHIWQVWGRFCRGVVFASCMGTVDVSGNHIPALASAHTVDHVSAAAIQAWRKKPVTWAKVNSILRNEPTWGDVDTLLDVVAGLSPGNASKISGMCSMATSGAKALQKARNAAAHHNHQTLAAIAALGSAYLAFPISHGCECLFWVDPASTNYLLPFAIDELKLAASYVVI